MTKPSQVIRTSNFFRTYDLIIKENEMTEDLPDIQGSAPHVNIPIQQVGVENVEVPFMLESKDGSFRDMIAKVSMFGSLDANTKGVSMSRFIRTLIPYLKKPLKHFMINDILVDLKNNLEVNDIYMKFEFKLPITRRSIKTDNEFPIFHDCKFEAQLLDGVFKFFQGVRVQYSSYCPCSAELCNHLGSGFPHAQRAFTDVLVEVGDSSNIIWLEDVIGLIESAVVNVPYPIIKRPDEQMIAQVASENPMFVEDAIRNIAQNLNLVENIVDYFVSCRHEESIHTSEASAMLWKGVPGGFDAKMRL